MIRGRWQMREREKERGTKSSYSRGTIKIRARHFLPSSGFSYSTYQECSSACRPCSATWSRWQTDWLYCTAAARVEGALRTLAFQHRPPAQLWAATSPGDCHRLPHWPPQGRQSHPGKERKTESMYYTSCCDYFQSDSSKCRHRICRTCMRKRKWIAKGKRVICRVLVLTDRLFLAW